MMRSTMIRNRGGAALAALALAAICIATLTPTPGTPTTPFWCIACGDRGLLDFAVNIVMFVPLGFALLLATERRRTSLFACVATTLAIELLQVRLVGGRDASMGDLLANTLGGAVGVALGWWRAVFLFPRPNGARRLAILWAVVFVTACSLTSAGLRPATVPRSLWVQWTPPRRGFEPFTGRVLAFDVDGIDLPLGFPAQSLGLDRVLRGNAWQATATVAAEQLQPRRSVIVRIADEFTVLVSIEQHGLDVTCMQKTRAADFRFRSPKVALENALPLSDGEASPIVRLRCMRQGATLVAGADGRQESVRLSPGLGWLIASPLDIVLTRARWWANALWLLGLTMPLGYWGSVAVGADTASRARQVAMLLALGGALVMGLAVAPAVTATAVASVWEWGSALCGVALGSALSDLARRRR